MGEELPDLNKTVSDFTAVIPQLTAAQLILVQNYLLIEAGKRLFAK